MFEGIGGAFYNRGDIVVDGESHFSLNEASVSVAGNNDDGICCVPCALIIRTRILAVVVRKFGVCLKGRATWPRKPLLSRSCGLYAGAESSYY